MRSSLLLITLSSFQLSAAGANAGVSAVFAITDSWATGYNGEITITNDGPGAINSWTLEFDFPGTITNSWNCTITSHVGQHYIVGNAAYNATIAVGGSVAFGFSADPASPSQPPVNYLINGVAASGAGPQVTTTSLPAAGIGVVYSQALTASGGITPYSWSLASGSLPAGLTLSTAGVISGTVNATTSSNFTVQVSDSSAPLKTATKALSLTVATLPTLSIDDVAVKVSSSPQGAGYLSTNGNQIVDSGGSPVRITGINWFGFETSNQVFHGLWSRGYKSALDQIKQLGFNTLRIPYSNQMLRAGAATNSNNFAENPDLQGLTPLQCLDKVIAYCGEIGLRVFLDRHSAKADHFLSEDVWFIPADAYYTEQRWIDDWVMLAQRYAGNPTVIGADLFNEPKNTATWGNSTPATDWNKAAERCGNAILAANPHWLIIVEGVQTFGGESYWWGGNLKGVASFPVTLATPNKLVYSMHDYCASVSAQPWFSAPDYPANLGGVWDAYWGYIYKNNTAPLLLGEFGSKLETVTDQQWLDKLTDYIDGDFDLNGTNDLPAGKKGISWTFWCFNPNSGDTGGILNDDWTTVNTAKLGYIQSGMAPLIASTSGGGQTATFTVTLSQPASGPVTVAWTTVDGSALAGVDYTAASGTLTFATGETSKTITVSLLPGAAPEETSAFSVRLSSPNGATIGDGTGTTTLAGNSWHYWRALHFNQAELADASISGEMADPYQSGFVNLLRYAFGASPNTQLPGLVLSTPSGRLALTFSHNTAASDVTLTVQGSDSLSGPWEGFARSAGGDEVAPLVGGVAVSETGSGTVRTVEVRDVFDIGALGHLQRFLRIRVQR